MPSLGFLLSLLLLSNGMLQSITGEEIPCERCSCTESMLDDEECAEYRASGSGMEENGVAPNRLTCITGLRKVEIVYGTCSGEPGPQGPEGPQGPQGPQGPDHTGEPGPPAPRPTTAATTTPTPMPTTTPTTMTPSTPSVTTRPTTRLMPTPTVAPSTAPTTAPSTAAPTAMPRTAAATTAAPVTEEAVTTPKQVVIDTTAVEGPDDVTTTMKSGTADLNKNTDNGIGDEEEESGSKTNSGLLAGVIVACVVGSIVVGVIGALIVIKVSAKFQGGYSTGETGTSTSSSEVFL